MIIICLTHLNTDYVIYEYEWSLIRYKLVVIEAVSSHGRVWLVLYNRVGLMTPLSQFLPDSLKAKNWTLRTLQVDNGTQKRQFSAQNNPWLGV